MGFESRSSNMAETWKLKTFQHTTKVEGAPIPDAEGHRRHVCQRGTEHYMITESGPGPRRLMWGYD